MENEYEITEIDWVIERENINDREYSAIWVNVDDIDLIENRKVWQLNQYKFAKSKSACTIVNAYKDLCYLWDKECTETEMLEFIDYCVTKWYRVGQWRYADFWNKYSVELWNTKYSDKQTSYVKIKRDDQDFMPILDKGQMLWCTYKWNRAYNIDYMKDCQLDWSMFWSTTYGHRTSILSKNKNIYVKNNNNSHIYENNNKNIYILHQK
jgi:hypothetical protein